MDRGRAWEMERQFEIEAVSGVVPGADGFDRAVRRGYWCWQVEVRAVRRLVMRSPVVVMIESKWWRIWDVVR